MTEKELEESFTVIKNTYDCHANEVLEKFGRYVKKNLLSIPKDIVLPEDKVHLTNAKYNGDDFTQDMMQFDHLRKEVSNAKYTKAVLVAKLANLEAVAERQQKVLTESVNLVAQGKGLVGLINQQHEVLTKKIQVLKPILDQIENNSSNLFK